MPKVKLKVCRVRYAPEDSRLFVDDKVGDQFDVTADEGWAMVDASQADWVGDAPERSEGESSDLFQLDLDNSIVGKLLALDANGKVPAFKDLAELRVFLATEGDLTEKSGFGQATAGKVVAAVNALNEPPALNESPTVDEDGEIVLE